MFPWTTSSSERIFPSCSGVGTTGPPGTWVGCGGTTAGCKVGRDSGYKRVKTVVISAGKTLPLAAWQQSHFYWTYKKKHSIHNDTIGHFTWGGGGLDGVVAGCSGCVWYQIQTRLIRLNNMITTYSSTQQSVAIDNYLPPFSVLHAQQVSIKVDTSSQTIVAMHFSLKIGT